MRYYTQRLLKIAQVTAGNVLIFFLLFSVLEIAYRIHRLGITEAFVTLANIFSEVPYSSIGTGNWVIADDILGYRLNPRQKGINSLSIRHKELVVPKPRGLYRLVYLGDSIPWDNPGFVSYTREKLRRDGNIEVVNAAVPGYTTYQELMFLKRYVLAASPDLVILTYCLNDNYKFLHRFDPHGRMLFTSEAEDALRIHSTFDKVVSRSYVLSRLKLGFLPMKKDWQRQSVPLGQPFGYE